MRKINLLAQTNNIDLIIQTDELDFPTFDIFLQNN